MVTIIYGVCISKVLELLGVGTGTTGLALLVLLAPIKALCIRNFSVVSLSAGL